MAIACHFSRFIWRTQKRTQLKNRYLKKRSYQNKRHYTKQRSFWIFLLRKAKKKHYANVNYKYIADKKQFWRTVKPLLSDKSKSNEKITLVEDNKIISVDKDNAEFLNSSFYNAVKSLKIPEFSDSKLLAKNVHRPIFKAILK